MVQDKWENTDSNYKIDDMLDLKLEQMEQNVMKVLRSLADKKYIFANEFDLKILTFDQ